MIDSDPALALPGLPALELRLILPDERPQFDQTLCAEHTLHNANLVGETLRYVAVGADGRWLALFGWSSPALRLRLRGGWLGWSEGQHAARLRLIAQNRRFLIRPNAPSIRISPAPCSPVAPGAWPTTGSPPTGTPGWWSRASSIRSGMKEPDTRRPAGASSARPAVLPATIAILRRSRSSQTALGACAPPQAQAWLRAETLPDHLAAQVPEPLPRCAYKSAQLGSLWQCFHDQLTAPRAPRGRRHLLSTILTIAAVATVAGERGPKGFARFAGELSQPQRRHLRCRPHPPTGVRQVPSEPTFRRASKRLDQGQFHAVLAEWLAAHDPEKHTAVAVDDKTVKCSRQKDGRPVHLMNAVTHRTQRLLNQIPVAEKSNEIPAFRPLLESLPLAGVLVTADAEHCQRAHARFLVYEKDADYLVLAKGNQPSLEALAQSQLPGGFSPSVRHA